jgi:hypothetical protein
LDFLLIGFPMHNSQLTKDDMTKIVVAAVHVVLRRDMSLNRRLFAWLLGTSANGLAMSGVGAARDDVMDSPEHKFSVYFNKYSRELLIHAVRQSLRDIPLVDVKTSSKPSNLKPFRILISLLDKPEIGPVILEDVLVDVFRCLFRECMPLLQKGSDTELEQRNSIGSKNGKNGKGKDLRSSEEKTATELIKTANLLFSTFEPYFLWDFLSRKFEEVCAETKIKSRSGRRACGGKQLMVKELCELVDFLLETVSVVGICFICFHASNTLKLCPGWIHTTTVYNVCKKCSVYKSECSRTRRKEGSLLLFIHDKFSSPQLGS